LPRPFLEGWFSVLKQEPERSADDTQWVSTYIPGTLLGLGTVI